MKRTSILFLSAFALFGALSCQKDSVDQNPNFDSDKNEVVADFVFNVATRSETKMSDGAAQATASSLFRGIENAKLFTYAEEASAYKGILPADKTAGKVFDLAAVAAPASMSASNSRRVLELSLPLKTNVLLFYGKAPYGDVYGGYSNLYDCYGHLDAYEVGVSTTNIEIGHRISSELYSKFIIVENLFAGIQSMLLNTTLPAGTVISATQAPSGVATKYKFDVTTASAINWESYAAANGYSPYETTHERYPLEDKLCALYRQLTTINSADGELRAGSGEAQVRVAHDLLCVLNEVRCAEPISEAETVAKYIANEIYNRTRKYFSASDEFTGGPVTNVTFQDFATVKAAFLSEAEKATRPYQPNDGTIWPSESDLNSVASYDLSEFPFNFNLPRGATHTAFNKTQKMFYYPQTFNVSGMGVPGVGDTYNARSYFYPAELIYFGNSPVRTSNASKKASDYPNGVANWDDDNSWDATWNGTQVSASTRAVAMTYDINYGVAMLETKVKIKESTTDPGYIYDNNHAVQEEWQGVPLDATEEPDKKIPITNGCFKLTGIIIGGQADHIGWDHLPAKNGDNYKYGFIYDKAISADAQPIPASGPSQSNYTLVFDNFRAASQTDGIYTPATDQDKVHVALEFRNDTGMDFYGNHNMIRDGGYFYLIGVLDPANKTISSWPTNHIIPPYTAAGASQQVSRVFIQDFKTTATFTIGPESLHNAYLTVPDLRSSSMNIGLSVDISWETGLNFDDVTLGNN